MGVTAWEIDDFARVELALESRGWQVEHCAHCDRSSRHPSCRIVRIPLRVFNAVARMEAPGSVHMHESFVPLILAPDWADAHPDEAPPRPGPDVLRELLDHLARKRDNP